VHARPATPDDAAEVARLGAVMFESMGLAPAGGWRGHAESLLRDGLGRGYLAAFVVDDPGGGRRLVANAAGTMTQRLPGPLNPGGRAGYVQYVCTDTGFRGRGLGRAVLEALLDWYRAQGVGVVELHATEDGLALYRSMGFDEGSNPALRLRLGLGQ
jgi:GNAT superfamily N-acetyltransferase